MPRVCCVLDCKSRDTEANRKLPTLERIYFHMLPVDRLLRKQWCEKIKRIDPLTNKVWEPTSKYNYICSKHFSLDDYDVGGPYSARKLRKGAVPMMDGNVATSEVVNQFQEQWRTNTNVQSHSELNDFEITTSQDVILKQGNDGTDKTKSAEAEILTYEFMHPQARQKQTGVTKSTEIEIQIDPNAILAQPDHNYASSGTPKRKYDQLEAKMANNFPATPVRNTKKFCNIGELIEILCNRHYIDQEMQKQLATFNDLDILLFKLNTNSYSSEMKRFCMTMKSYSKDLYHLVRSQFRLLDLDLPRLKTVSSWFNSTDGKPGFNNEAFEYLNSKTNHLNGLKYKQCSLVFGSMPLKELVRWDSSLERVEGLCDLGLGEEHRDGRLPAREAVVLMAVSLEGYWKVPLGYFFVNKFRSQIQHDLIGQCLCRLYAINVVAKAIICDPNPVNLDTLTLFGVDLTHCSVDRHWFFHPSNPNLEVYIIVDVCQQLENLGTAFAASGTLVWPQVGLLDWKFISGLGLISDQHFAAGEGRDLVRRQMLEIGVAEGPFSPNVGLLLGILKEFFVNFQGCEATIQFLLMLGKLNEIFNCSSPYNNPFSHENIHSTVEFLKECKGMLLGLQDASKRKIVQGNRKRVVLGLVMSINSFISISEDFQMINISKNNSAECVLPYKFSQEHLETFFDAIRRTVGHVNPTVAHFEETYRATLRTAGIFANNISTFASKGCMVGATETPICKPCYLPRVDQCVDPLLTPEDRVALRGLNVECAQFEESLASYISGIVVKSLVPLINCCECKMRLFHSDGYVVFPYVPLVELNGLLVYPSQEIRRIVIAAEKAIRCSSHFGMLELLADLVLNGNCGIFNDLHLTDIGLSVHALELTRSVIETYVKIRRSILHSVHSSRSQLPCRRTNRLPRVVVKLKK